MLAIFDWDGTLADTKQKIVTCLRKASISAELPILTDEQYQQIIGLGLPEAVLALYPDQGPVARARMQEAYSQHFVADTAPVRFFEGVEQGLLDLKSAGVKLAVATGKSRKGLNRQLTHFGIEGWFDITRCADETASKPDPLMLQQILSQTGVDAGDAVMVGDTSFDLHMANKAAMRSIGVSYGAHSVNVLAACKPIAIADDFEQVFQTLLGCFTG